MRTSDGRQIRLEPVYRRHGLLAEAARRAVDVWAREGALSFNIVEPAERANSVTTVLINGDGVSTSLLDYCESKCGVVLGIGIGEQEDRAFRIAHMGHINAPMILGTLGSVEMGLIALQIPHGAGGVQAAADYLGRNVTG